MAQTRFAATNTPRNYRLETEEGTVVAGEVELATSFTRRLLGLMFRQSLAQGRGLVLTPCSSVHMLFMRFPLDVAFVDNEGVVLHVLHSLRPWRASRFVRKARAAIELPEGTLAAAGVTIGTRLRLV
jgi:uncharacterized membrane protein (UPF0127 family)